MYKIGLKLWSTNLQYILCAEELYEKGFYNYIELYIVPNTFNNFSQKWKKLKIPFIIHAPHFTHKMCLSRKSFLSNNLILTNETIKFADLLNSEIIIYHPGIYGNIDETINQLNTINEPRICLENKPFYILNSGKGTVHSPQHVKYVIENTNVGFCYDIGHGICSSNFRKINIFDDMNQYLSLSPKMFHLTDGNMYGLFDQHLHLKKGNFDFEKIISKIPQNSLITVETYKDYKTSLDDFKSDCKLFNFLTSQNNNTKSFDGISSHK